jgi:hypothetical protein
VISSMRLGVPFIAPRQLGAVESISRRRFLPSVAYRTGQSGAPPDTVRCGFLSFFGEADRWRTGQSGAPPDTVRCGFLSFFGEADRWRTGQCPVHTGQSGASSDRWLLPRVARGFHGRPLAGPTFGSPDSPMIYSRTPLIASREQPVDRHRHGAPDTVRCITG